MGRSRWELRGDQGLTGEEEGGGGVRGSGRLESKRASGMGREGASAALEPVKRGPGGCTGGSGGSGELSLGGISGRRRGGRGKCAGGQKRGARAALGLGNDAWR
jgi:hypothetical protein